MRLCKIVFVILALFIIGGYHTQSTFFKKEPMHIFLITDNQYASHTGVTIQSILETADSFDSFNFYIIHSGLSTQNIQNFQNMASQQPAVFEFIKVDDSLFKQLKVTRTAKETYYRYLIPFLKLDLEKILYLDSDLIVLKSLQGLWQTDISTVYAAGARNGSEAVARMHGKKFGIKKYFNAGILLLNLEKIRQDNLVNQFFKNTILLEEKGLLYLEDQDVLNYTFKDNILYLPDIYNHSADEAITDKTVIIHFWGPYKPWFAQRSNDQYYHKIWRKLIWQ